jgi:hypothetical protein
MIRESYNDAEDLMSRDLIERSIFFQKTRNPVGRSARHAGKSPLDDRIVGSGFAYVYLFNSDTRNLQFAYPDLSLLAPFYDVLFART